jgi:hypothetical protein
MENELKKARETLRNLNNAIGIARNECYNLKQAIDKAKEPEIKEGDWIYTARENAECIARFKSQTIFTEFYMVYTDGTILEREIGSLLWNAIKEILTKIAISKGFVEGAKFKSMKTGDIYTIESPLDLFSDGDLVCYPDLGGVVIYSNSTRKWAEIIKEPEIIINGKPVQFNEDSTICEIYRFPGLNRKEIEAIINLLGMEKIWMRNIICNLGIPVTDLPALKEILKIMK